MTPRSTQTGYSLLELLLAMSVLLMLMAGVLTLFLTHQRTNMRGQAKVEIQQNARIAIEMASREIRLAGYDPGNEIQAQATPVAVQVADSNRLTFLADVDGDGTLDEVSYRQQGDNFVREFSSWDGTAFPAPVSANLASGISTVILTYFDDATPTNNPLAAPVATPGNIRRVNIGLVTSKQWAVDAQVSFTVAMDVKLRNLF